MMPIYRYRREDTNELVEMTMSVAEHARKQKRGGRIRLDDGSYALRDWAPQSVGKTRKPGCWPMRSDAMGVNPDQIPDAVAECNRHGISAEFHSETGQLKLDSPKHRKQHARLRGLRDLNGGYSDP